jgi:hypothetical protein
MRRHKFLVGGRRFLTCHNQNPRTYINQSRILGDGEGVGPRDEDKAEAIN